MVAQLATWVYLRPLISKIIPHPSAHHVKALDDSLIDKLSNLAKLQFADAEREAIKADLTRILTFIETIQQVDTEALEPLIHLTTEINRFSEDVPQTTISQAEALANAPKKESDYFRVPRVVNR
jgi:aspartyl-tRNA(Asn)/glutamyl-tRNA(Gln) amidotransferase subunit C